MTKVEKAIQDLALRIQTVLWELEGYQENEMDAGRMSDSAGSGGGAWPAALQKIQQVERTKLRVHEAERAAKRIGHDVAGRIQAALALLYAELSAAEFSAKDAMQNSQINLIRGLLDQGYEQARRKTHQTLQDELRKLQSH